MARKSGLSRLWPVAVTMCVAAFLGASFARAQMVDYGQVAAKVADLLQREHYNDQAINDKVSDELLRNYLEFLDPGRLYFLQGDIEFLEAKYSAQLDNLLMAGNISPAKEIYDIYERRVLDRVGRVQQLLAEEKEFTFDSSRTMQISRKDLPWPATVEEADQLWHDLIEGELLQEVLRQEAAEEAKAKKAAEKPEEAGMPPAAKEPMGEDALEEVEISKPNENPREVVAKRYERIKESLKENGEEDIAGFYLKALAHTYDPHSEYFTQSEYDNFRISMQKSLEGIGALLSMGEDGYAEIRGLVVNGPADKGGELQVGDRIVSVAQGPRSESEDIKGMKLQKVVDLIRGKRGSTVVLEVIPNGADPSARKLIAIKRNKVDLKESLARAELIVTKDGQGNPLRLGWIDLPSFYSDMETGETSVTKDTRRLLERLIMEGMDGLILDLRDNGGGSLEEAINLTGLFIPKGPVVQSKDSLDQVEVKMSRAPKPAYEGPLVVLTSKSSASASEILAAALQDYGRAVIVGESSTFGKGTVQQLLPVTTNNFALLLPGANHQSGALKLTIQKFYRIAGGSTQKKGVIPDIHLPSLTDSMDHGEASLKNSLPYDEIPSQRFALFAKDPLPCEELRRRSAERIARDPDFQWVVELTERYRARQEANVIALNREVRKQEMAEQEARDDAREEQIAAYYAAVKEAEKGLFADFSLTLDNVGVEKLPLLSDVNAEELSGMMTARKNQEKTDKQKAMEPPHGFGHVKREAIEITKDLIDLHRLARSRKITLSEAGSSGIAVGKP